MDIRNYTDTIRMNGYNLEVVFDAFMNETSYMKATRLEPESVEYEVEVEILDMKIIGEEELIDCDFGKDFENSVCECIKENVYAGDYF